MSGYEIYKRVLSRLGYDNTSEKLSDKALLMRARELINQICFDLKIPQINILSEQIKTDASGEEAILCGVSMLFALGEGDAAKNKLYTDLYNSKRAAFLSGISNVEDVLPVSQDGGF